ncbi:protein mono-ADP-ribosyltransferase PARP14-like [Saccostrea cucullata]|uniref:protein mono-ADP-ribosyltransferase PARP14-like n=1 Tax=Saccostrea cuccullata TaxID=36930 RepID=UPI002ED3FFD8
MFLEKDNYREIVGNIDKVEHYKKALKKIRSMNDEKLNIDQKMINVFKSNEKNIETMFPGVLFLLHENMLHLISSEDLTDCKSKVEKMLTSPQEGTQARRHGRSYRKGKDNNTSHHSNSKVETQNPAPAVNISIDTPVYKNKDMCVYIVYRDILSGGRADCFVNPTNEYLKLDSKGGVTAAVLKMAGNDVQKECNELMKTKSKLQPAECARTGAGHMNYKSIIHTNIKPWKDFINRETQVQEALNHIQYAVRNSLIMADGQKMKSIAIPAIGSGQSGIPHILCATGYRMGCELFMKSAASNLKHIFFISNNDEFMSLVEMTFKTPLPWYSFWPKSEEYTFRISKGCSVIIAQRDVLKEKSVDGLVVLEDPFLLGQGKLVKAVIDLGGNVFSNNRKKLMSKNKPPGSAVTCKCQAVCDYKTIFHIIMPDCKKKPWTQNEVSVYKDCISQALSSSKEEKSIAMKLFLGRASNDVAMYLAKALVETVTEYIKSNRSSSLQQIRILNMDPFRHGLVKRELVRFTKEACNSNSYLEKAIFVNAYLDPQTDQKYVPGTRV